MASIICCEVYPRKNNVSSMRRVLVNKHGFEEKQNSRGVYFYNEVSSMDFWQLNLVLKFHNYKFKTYDKRYSRSTSYRKTFFANNKGPYRCVYCGKRITAETLEVDHLLPVAQAKDNLWVRTLLHLSGAKNVNDSKNLVQSCTKCNRKKSDKMGLWVIRGIIGRFDCVWVIRDIVVAILVIVAILIFVNAVDLSWLQDLFK